MEDYAIMSNEDGIARWATVNIEHSQKGRTRMAILEKDSMQSKTEVTDK